VLAHKATRGTSEIILTGTSPEMRADLIAHGIKPPLVRFEPTIEIAVARVHQALKEGIRPDPEPALSS
jgi:SulP family sulfate permease